MMMYEMFENDKTKQKGISDTIELLIKTMSIPEMGEEIRFLRFLPPCGKAPASPARDTGARSAFVRSDAALRQAHLRLAGVLSVVPRGGARRTISRSGYRLYPFIRL